MTSEDHIVIEEKTTPQRGKEVIRVRNLKKAFGDHKVLNGISLDLYESENLVILGRSGTGKSVLIKCLIGLIKPDEGEMTMLDQEMLGLSEEELNALRLQIGFSFQSSALYDSMSVRENLEFPLKRNLGIFEPDKLRADREQGLDGEPSSRCREPAMPRRSTT